MERRDFVGGLAAAAAFSRWPPRPPSVLTRGQSALRVDRGRLARSWSELARFGANAAGGIDRVAFSDADLEARAWVRSALTDAGLDVDVDLAGNLVGRRPGADPSLPPLVTGSHVDSVPGGGNFDGQVGTLGAIEVARVLHDAGRRLRHTLQVYVFSNEEGGKTGSRALAGEVEPFELDLPTASGFSIGQGVARLGGDPERLPSARLAPGAFTAFFELHVEQGAVLDAGGIDIGVVEGIVGIRRWNVTVEGETNHAGTTPMDRRSDALVAASRMIDGVHATARTLPGRHVATVGRLEVLPGAPNVIPGLVTFSLEIRDLAMERIDQIFDAIRSVLERTASETGTRVRWEPFYRSGAAPTDPGLRDVVEHSADALGLTTLRMPSGAGHDAQSMARIGPVGMVFVPSRDGVSHAPEEFTEPDDVANGADVLLASLLAMDAAG